MRCVNRLSLVIAVSAVVYLAGCGGSNGTSPSPDTSRGMALRQDVGDGAATEPGAAAAMGTGWGDMTGTFVFTADPPSLPLLSTGGKDAPTCPPEGVINETLVLDESTKGIANIIIYARNANRMHEDFKEGADETVVFDQKDCIFLSHVVAMRTSQPLDIRNSDPIAHNTNMSPPGDTAINPLLSAEQSVEHKFGRQQTTPVAVACNIHPWMKAYILPRNDPYAVVTSKEGQFELKNLPAGEAIEFQLWHEAGTGDRGALVIDGLTDGRGRFTQTIPEDGTLELGTVEVGPGSFKFN